MSQGFFRVRVVDKSQIEKRLRIITPNATRVLIELTANREVSKMTSKKFREIVGLELKIDVTDAQVRHAIKAGDLGNVPKRGGWYVFSPSHVELMENHLRRCSRKLTSAECSA